MEKYIVYVLRRGLSYWSGRTWKLGIYDAKLFGMEKHAEETRKKHGNDIKIVQCVIETIKEN